MISTTPRRRVRHHRSPSSANDDGRSVVARRTRLQTSRWDRPAPELHLLSHLRLSLPLHSFLPQPHPVLVPARVATRTPCPGPLLRSGGNADIVTTQSVCDWCSRHGTTNPRRHQGAHRHTRYPSNQPIVHGSSPTSANDGPDSHPITLPTQTARPRHTLLPMSAPSVPDTGRIAHRRLPTCSIQTRLYVSHSYGRGCRRHSQASSCNPFTATSLTTAPVPAHVLV